MKPLSLDDIKIFELKKISTNQGGDVMHFIKKSDPFFVGFGEVYFSWIDFEMTKAWKKHLEMTLNLVVPLGSVRFVFHLPEESTKFRVEEIGISNYKRIVVPPGIWFGFKGLEKKNLVSNFADIEHDPKENIKLETNSFSYKW